MKRKLPSESRSWTTGDIKADLAPEQLQGIGALAIAWNEAEAFIDFLLYIALSLSNGVWLDVVTRINGMEGKIEIIKKAAEDLGLSEEELRLVQASLGDLQANKKFRDAVIHARVYDSRQGIGTVVERRANVSQVLLTTAALDGLYERLVLQQQELDVILGILDLQRRARALNADVQPPLQAQVVKLRELQTRRRALPPLPNFPEN